MTLIVHWKPGHGTTVEEPISVIVVLVFSKHNIGLHVFGCFDAEGPVIKISYEVFWLFGNNLGFFSIKMIIKY